MYINTDNGAVIDQKETYVDGKYWFDANGFEGYKSVASADEPAAIQIRGRGNSTWSNFDKKPYKIKLGKKAALLDTEKSKHYALLALIGGNPTYFSHALGMELGQHLIKGWTPRMRPVEVVLNGQYIGLYFLTENVRIDKGRVDIPEQAADNQDAATIDGGYLVEIDNYTSENQIKLFEGDVPLLITPKTPEPMNELHVEYLTEQFNAMTAAFHYRDPLSRQWEDYIDIDSYARHYVVEEIMHNWDAYSGSCYLHKDFGGKWTFGPLWDLGDTFDQFKGDFVYNETPFRKTWITRAVKFPRFIKKVQEVWAEFKAIDPEVWNGFLDSWNNAIEAAEDQNQKVWNYYRGSKTSQRLSRVKGYLKKKTDWLDTQWGAGALTCNVSVGETDGGRVLLGGHDYADVDLFVGSHISICFVADEGNYLKSVTVDGRDLTRQVVDNTLSLSRVDADMLVVAEFDADTGIEGVAGDAAAARWRVDGDMVVSVATVEIYTAAGVLVGRGTEVRLPAAGIYLCHQGGHTDKFVVR